MESGRRNFRDRALPALFILLGALGWSVCSAASAAIGLYARNRLETDHVADIITLFFTGGFFGWLLALAALRVLPALKSQQLRLATACLAIAFFTLAVAAALFAFEYRIFYAQWHAPTFSRIWFFSSFSRRSVQSTSSSFRDLVFIFPSPHFRSCPQGQCSAGVHRKRRRHAA